jgi:hypothetical protein
VIISGAGGDGTGTFYLPSPCPFFILFLDAAWSLGAQHRKVKDLRLFSPARFLCGVFCQNPGTPHFLAKPS